MRGAAWTYRQAWVSSIASEPSSHTIKWQCVDLLCACRRCIPSRDRDPEGRGSSQTSRDKLSFAIHRLLIENLGNCFLYWLVRLELFVDLHEALAYQFFLLIIVSWTWECWYFLSQVSWPSTDLVDLYQSLVSSRYRTRPTRHLKSSIIFIPCHPRRLIIGQNSY